MDDIIKSLEPITLTWEKRDAHIAFVTLFEGKNNIIKTNRLEYVIYEDYEDGEDGKEIFLSVCPNSESQVVYSLEEAKQIAQTNLNNLCLEIVKNIFQVKE